MLMEPNDEFSPSTIEQSPIADTLGKYNTHIRLANFSALQSLIRPGSDPSVIFNNLTEGNLEDALKVHPFNLTQIWGPNIQPWGNYSSPTSPHFIYDGGAADCTVLMSVNSDGSVLTFHHPLYAEKRSILVEILDVYKQKTFELLGSNSLTVVTGTNVQWLEDPGPAKDGYLQDILLILADLQPQLLVTRQSASQKIFTPLPEVIKRIEGVAILPRQLSITDKNECMLFTDGTIEQERQIRNKYRVGG